MPITSPPQEDRLSGLATNSQLKPGAERIEQAKSKVLAIVYSVNVPKQLASNQELMSRFDGTNLVSSVFAGGAAAKEDGMIVFSSDRLLEAVLAGVKDRFKEVVLAKDLPDAFDKGADVVGILDLRLAYVWDSSETRKMVYEHTANTSMLFINRRLEAGPEAVANITYKQDTPAAGADANNRDFTVAVKDARTQMVRKISAEFDQKISK